MGQIVSKHEFVEIRKRLKSNGKTIVLCHGVFDLVHPGHIIHFEEAKKLGNILVVSRRQNMFAKVPADLILMTQCGKSFYLLLTVLTM